MTVSNLDCPEAFDWLCCARQITKPDKKHAAFIIQLMDYQMKYLKQVTFNIENIDFKNRKKILKYFF